MGIETLNSAARAAGFAMAASDEPYEEVKSGVTVEPANWRPAEAALLSGAGPQHRSGDWFRTMFGIFGRRAPASPA